MIDRLDLLRHHLKAGNINLLTFLDLKKEIIQKFRFEIGGTLIILINQPITLKNIGSLIIPVYYTQASFRSMFLHLSTLL